MRAVEEMAAAWERFLGVLEGVGSIVVGSMVGAASDDSDGPSESEAAQLGLRVCFRGVLVGERRCVRGEAGDEGGLESWVGCRAKRAFFTTVGGGVVRALLVLGEWELLKLE